MQNGDKDERAQSWRARGYFIVPGFLPASATQELRRACDIALEAVRASSSETGHTTHRISLFADPSHFAADSSALERLVAFAGSPAVCALLSGLVLDCEGLAPRLKTIDYYHEQTRHDWDGDWHRDTQFGAFDPDQERKRLLGPLSAHIRVAFEPDDRLEIVPGSHAKWDTPDELRIRRGSNRATCAMPGATRIALRPGDACVFHAASIHRATYRRTPLRRTLDMVFRWEPTTGGHVAEHA